MMKPHVIAEYLGLESPIEAYELSGIIGVALGVFIGLLIYRLVMFV